ncbi:phosphomannomutase [Ferrimonas balearica]|uniref:phosphomannomutase n=1 Tax=Ferrimonas balearica TaxID=44012 RepID=UPI001C55C520|nr:phosphomannomutase [Ferrimonas balearica]MBW3164220.1 phosphomannomutase [Ferrimonas balearica]
MHKVRDILAESGVKFGTSGARGLVSQFTPQVCAAFTLAFLRVMQRQFDFSEVAIAIDNRPSSQAMAESCASAVQQLGLKARYYGVVPTPALAHLSMEKAIPAIMVTGSHIPFDRNGLKFYRPDGEISKEDEQAIIACDTAFDQPTAIGSLVREEEAEHRYIERYLSLFPTDLLKGKRIGIYEHSSAGRDIYHRVFTALGAEAIALERTEEFVPIDTEAVSEQDKQKARDWARQYQFDAIFSTDGDGDRPLIADEHGEWLRGDILGLLCSKALGIEALAVPVSCNSAIEASGYFKVVKRTRIGSPYVIAEFSSLQSGYSSIAGFEANGGYLLGSDLHINGKELRALPTRDALLPALMLLALASDKPVSELLTQLPNRYTHSDRLQGFATERSQALIADATVAPQRLIDRLRLDANVAATDVTDGLRISLDNGNVVHLRPSGNAPELRCYAESTQLASAIELVGQVLQRVEALEA